VPAPLHESFPPQTTSTRFAADAATSALLHDAVPSQNTLKSLPIGPRISAFMHDFSLQTTVQS